MNNYYMRGGRVDYGIGGALLKLGSNLASGKGFGKGALKGVGKAAVTPGSGIGAGASLAGNLLQKSKNPALQGIGKAAGVASNFMPGGGGIGGAIGALAGGGGQGGQGGGMLQNLMGGGQGGGGGLLNMAQGFLGAEQGAMIPARLRGVKLMKRDSMGDGGMVYEDGGMVYEDGGLVYAENGTKTPGGPPRYFQPQIAFDMDKGVGDERFFDDPDQKLQQKVDRGLASKADRDSRRYTRDFNPIPTKDLLDMEKVALRERIRNYPEMVAADKFGASNFLKLDGEFVEQTPKNEQQMLLNRSATLEEFPNIQRSKLKDDFVTDLYEPAIRENYQTYGPAKDLLISSTGFTREELGGPVLGSSTLGTKGKSIDQQRVSGDRAAQYLEDKLREEADRMGRLYDAKYEADAAERATKFQRGGRTPLRLIKRR